jgi:hypothetical protein
MPPANVETFCEKNSTAINSGKRIGGLLKNNNDDANNREIATESYYS